MIHTIDQEAITAMKQGDLVVRKSYGGDVLFKIQELTSQKALLKGMDYRLLADSPIYDLSVVQADSYIIDPASVWKS